MSSCRALLLSTVAALSLSISSMAVALPTGTLSFTVPTGTVGPNDPVPVTFTLNLDSGSTPLITGSAGFQILSGLDTGDLPDGFNLSHANINVFFECSGNFTSTPSPFGSFGQGGQGPGPIPPPGGGWGAA